MRNYVRGYYGIYHEDNSGLGIHLTLPVWRRSLVSFQAAIAELDADVKAAGAGWTGTLQTAGQKWWKFGDDDIQDVLETWYHGTSQASTAFSDAMDANLTDDSPRSEGYNSATER